MSNRFLVNPRRCANAKYLESVQEGLRHVGGHATYHDSLPLVDHPATMIEEARGSRDGCIRGLEMHHRARAIVAWFGNHDLAAFKQESYVASKLMYIIPDPRKPGFFKYTNGFAEMVYNPTTKEVWHLQPLR